MIWVFLRDQIAYWPGGESVVNEAGSTTVYGKGGRTIARYESQSVLVYTSEKPIAVLLGAPPHGHTPREIAR